MIGQKQYSLRDKLSGKKPGDVRVKEDAGVVKQRLASMVKKEVASKKKKPGAVSRAVSKIISKIVTN